MNMRSLLRKDLKSPLDIEATQITIFQQNKDAAYETSQNKLMRKISVRYFRGQERTGSIYRSHQVQGGAPDIRSVPES